MEIVSKEQLELENLKMEIALPQLHQGTGLRHAAAITQVLHLNIFLDLLKLQGTYEQVIRQFEDVTTRFAHQKYST